MEMTSMKRQSRGITKKETGQEMTEEKFTQRRGKAIILGREPWCLMVMERRAWTLEMEHKVCDNIYHSHERNQRQM